MSKLFRETSGKMNKPTITTSMRNFSKRPGRIDPKTKLPIYTTAQAPKDICDINNIIRMHDKNGLITHVNSIEAKYGDLTGIDFQSAHDLLLGTYKMFMDLPSNIRKRFDNDPQMLIEFMDDENNRDEAIELGLIRAEWTPETDGIGPGEHIKKDEDRKKITNPDDNQDD